MSQSEKNNSPIPNIESTGRFLKPIQVETNKDPAKKWYLGLTPWQRLNSHQTYSSVRRNVNFKPFRMIKDHLDVVLITNYQHGEEVFPDPIDVYFRKSTVNEKPPPTEDDTFYGDKKLGEQAFIEPQTYKEIRTFVRERRLFRDHPLIIGGIKERVAPTSVKLMNSSHHSPQTNAGYMRQPEGGTIFYY